MINVNDRVQHIDEKLNSFYGIMTVIQIKGDYAVCHSGDFHNIKVETIKVKELIKV